MFEPVQNSFEECMKLRETSHEPKTIRFCPQPWQCYPDLLHQEPTWYDNFRTDGLLEYDLITWRI